MENEKNQNYNDDLSNQKIMLIGGAGFIGHHLALELRKKKAAVTVVDNLQVNNIVQMLSDTKISEKKKSLHPFYFRKISINEKSRYFLS